MCYSGSACDEQKEWLKGLGAGEPEKVDDTNSINVKDK